MKPIAATKNSVARCTWPPTINRIREIAAETTAASANMGVFLSVKDKYTRNEKGDQRLAGPP
jgi:hypothetical protein